MPSAQPRVGPEQRGVTLQLRLHALEADEGRAALVEEDVVWLQPRVDERVVDVQHGHAPSLQLGAEQGVLVAIVRAGVVEADVEEQLPVDEDGSRTKQGVCLSATSQASGYSDTDNLPSGSAPVVRDEA